MRNIAGGTEGRKALPSYKPLSQIEGIDNRGVNLFGINMPKEQTAKISPEEAPVFIDFDQNSSTRFSPDAKLI